MKIISLLFLTIFAFNHCAVDDERGADLKEDTDQEGTKKKDETSTTPVPQENVKVAPVHCANGSYKIMADFFWDNNDFLPFFTADEYDVNIASSDKTTLVRLKQIAINTYKAANVVCSEFDRKDVDNLSEKNHEDSIRVDIPALSFKKAKTNDEDFTMGISDIQFNPFNKCHLSKIKVLNPHDSTEKESKSIYSFNKRPDPENTMDYQTLKKECDTLIVVNPEQSSEATPEATPQAAEAQ